jgi:hypothetical protein
MKSEANSSERSERSHACTSNGFHANEMPDQNAREIASEPSNKRFCCMTNAAGKWLHQAAVAHAFNNTLVNTYRGRRRPTVNFKGNDKKKSLTDPVLNCPMFVVAGFDPTRRLNTQCADCRRTASNAGYAFR